MTINIEYETDQGLSIDYAALASQGCHRDGVL